MPRKPGPPPTILRIEDIATGREIREASFVDDFTGQAIPIAQDIEAKPPRIQDGQAEMARLSNVRQGQAQALLTGLGFGAKDTPQDTIHRPKAVTLRRL